MTRVVSRVTTAQNDGKEMRRNRIGSDVTVDETVGIEVKDGTSDDKHVTKRRAPTFDQRQQVTPHTCQ